MTADPGPALCLDLTRLVRRAGRGPLTGIDRVERAWLRHALALPQPVFGLVRSTLGFLLLDRAALAALAGWVEAGGVPAVHDPLLPLRRLVSRTANAAEAALGRRAAARCTRPGLARMLRRHLPPGAVYVNVGHSNLRERALRAWRAVPEARVAVLIHDTIPLDLPGSQRPGMAASFRARLAAVSAQADRVAYVSSASRAAAEAHLAAMGRVPPGVVAPIGVDPPRPDPALLPPGLPPGRPYFVALGTIEPRKDHALLLDVWERLAEGPGPRPHLLILGRRGWANEAVFRRLDALRGRPDAGVHEIAGLPDGAVAALVQGAAALLMPSRAEGFGLPVAEAMMLGTPVIAADLPVYRETAGDYPIYLAPGDVYSWAETVMKSAGTPRARTGGTARRMPGWDDHFTLVLKGL